VTREDRVLWHRNLERRYPFGAASPDPERFEPLGFPPPWPKRPWIYSNVIASKDGIVAWKRKDPADDPARTIAGSDPRPGRVADLCLMRYLRALSDAVSMGAQTLREDPDLVATPGDVGGELGGVFYRFRAEHGFNPFPLQIVYSEHGLVRLDLPIFTTTGLTAIVVTTELGARLLRSQGSDDKGITVLVAGAESIDPAGFVRSHERLLDEFGVRYLECEGGPTVLNSLHSAGILDEVFVTVTDVAIDPAQHDGVKKIFAFETEGARLIAEGHAASDSGYVFRRWRFNER
jgi:riboflavin biosynthesis pyrimidine reductase